MLLMFDIRQTARCLESMEGLSRFPIHTICSLQPNHCSRKVLTASSAGPCLWDASGCGERPFLIPGLENQGICISLATGLSNGEIVASFRPKIELPGDAAPSQTPASPSQPIYSAGKLGSHVNIKMINGTSFQTIHAVSGYVSEVRMSKSAIICPERNNSRFAFGDESTHGVCLWNLPSFHVHSRHRPHLHPILDLKYSSYGSSGLLGCLSESKLQVFTCL
ncbi:hypothetical protein KSP39_PZI014664 [Platanthera zijinensis]|uniref:Uncharacterized protein n=1 Tax=Platanthera zijinensis TaxID=2320716 RepID=A0AAP0BA39_9ASPA